MSRLSYKTCVRSIFEPLALAAGRMDLLETLNTQPVASNRKHEQFRRLASLRIDTSDAVYLPSGGFVALYCHCGGRYLAVSSSALVADDENKLLEWASQREIEQDIFDESTFLGFAHFLKGYYKTVDRFRIKADATDVIDVVDVNYLGHNIDDLISYYRPVHVFKLPDDNPLQDHDIFDIASDVCCSVSSLRSVMVDEELSGAIDKLRLYSSVPNENLYQALTASHYRHVFLEVYRCLEAIFFLPWLLEFKKHGQIQARAVDLKLVCRSALLWREKEKPSIEQVFGLVSGDAILDSLESSIELFADIKNSDSFSRHQIGGRVYAIRNGLVHHEDYEQPNQYKPNNVQWRLLSLYVATILERIIRIYQRDLTPS